MVKAFVEHDAQVMNLTMVKAEGFMKGLKTHCDSASPTKDAACGAFLTALGYNSIPDPPANQTVLPIQPELKDSLPSNATQNSEQAETNVERGRVEVSTFENDKPIASNSANASTLESPFADPSKGGHQGKGASTSWTDAFPDASVILAVVALVLLIVGLAAGYWFFSR